MKLVTVELVLEAGDYWTLRQIENDMRQAIVDRYFGGNDPSVRSVRAQFEESEESPGQAIRLLGT